jgi:hypothetical protein
MASNSRISSFVRCSLGVTFVVGEARLGSDTLIDLGSRAPELTPPMVLDREHLAEAYLAPGHPQDVRERFVVGREQRSGSI